MKATASQMTQIRFMPYTRYHFAVANIAKIGMQAIVDSLMGGPPLLVGGSSQSSFVYSSYTCSCFAMALVMTLLFVYSFCCHHFVAITLCMVLALALAVGVARQAVALPFSLTPFVCFSQQKRPPMNLWPLYSMA